MALFGSSDDDLQPRVDELERRVAALERLLDRTPNRPPVGELGESWVSEEVRRLAMSGNKIQAIKVLRDETGVDLKRAKDIVDGL